MNDATRARVDARMRELGLDTILARKCAPDAWSGQGPAALARLLRAPAMDPAARPPRSAAALAALAALALPSGDPT